jgi:hypothetical protein
MAVPCRQAIAEIGVDKGTGKKACFTSLALQKMLVGEKVGRKFVKLRWSEMGFLISGEVANGKGAKGADRGPFEMGYVTRVWLRAFIGSRRSREFRGRRCLLKGQRSVAISARGSWKRGEDSGGEKGACACFGASLSLKQEISQPATRLILFNGSTTLVVPSIYRKLI